MRIDGEPWKQPLPVDDETVTIEISHFGQVNMLARPSCRSQSVYDPSSPASPREEDDDTNSNEEGSSEDSEERSKFGAAKSFKFPDRVDISQLS